MAESLKKSVTTRVLSLSANPELGKLRVMVLRQAGYHVVWPSTKTEAEQVIGDQHFDVLLIGHTISGDTARDLAEAFRGRNPAGKVIAITASAYIMVRTDKTLRAIDGPEALLEAIQEVLESTPTSDG
jgi:DNA-binding response OmpR family regulator